MAPSLHDSRARFTATVDDYDRWRPGYPAQAIDWIATTAALRPTRGSPDIGRGDSTILFSDPNID